MNTPQHPRYRRHHPLASLASATSVIFLALLPFGAVTIAQQGTAHSKDKTQASGQGAAKAADKHESPKPAGQQGTSGTQPQPAQGTAPASGQAAPAGGSQSGAPAAQDQAQGGAQQPTVIPDKPMCPCPLVTKDPFEPHFQEVCGRCHTPDRITGIKKSGLEWKETIEKMILKGAQVSDEDYDPILAFLVRNFDRIDINWVESGELVVALGLTQDEAEKIVAYRKEHGDFKDFDSVTKVPGVDVKKLEAKKSSFMFY
jgi:competence protein ComEA